MCCLRYEHDFYVQSRKKYPKEGKPVRTSRGEEKVIANDIFRERVTLRGLDGEMRTLALEALREEMLAAGDALAPALAAAATLVIPVAPIEDDDDDLDQATDAAIDSGHSPDHVSVAPVVVSEPDGETTEETPDDVAAEEGRRPQRRRGRRGGRRNRPGGASGPRAPADGGVPS
jgi:hypothetical protein